MHARANLLDVRHSCAINLNMIKKARASRIRSEPLVPSCGRFDPACSSKVFVVDASIGSLEGCLLIELGCCASALL